MDPYKFSFTPDKSKATPYPAAITVPKPSGHADNDPPWEISPKTEVTPPQVTETAAYKPKISFKGEKSDPESDPFLDTPSRTNYDRTAPSRWPPIEPPSSKGDNDPTKGSPSREPLQSIPPLSSSPRLKPNKNYTRAFSAPPPFSGTVEKVTLDPPTGKLSDPVDKALKALGEQRKSDADHTVETAERQKPKDAGLWHFRKPESREEDITTDEKQEILADVLSSNSKYSSIQPAGVGGSPAILFDQASDGEDPSKVQSAPMTPPLQTTQPREDSHEPLEKALESVSSSATLLDPEKVSQNNSTRKIRSIRKRRNDSSISSPAATTSLGTSPEPYSSANDAKWQQSSSKDFDTVKSELGSEIQTPHEKSSDCTAFTLNSETETGTQDMDQMQHADSLEAESMIDHLLGLKYFEGAQSSLDQLSLILRLLQQRDLRSSTQALLAAQKETAHVQPSVSALATDTEKLYSGKCNESTTAGPDVKIDKPVDKELSRLSCNPPDPKCSSLLPVPSSSQGRSASESAIPTRGKIFRDVPGLPMDVDTNVRSTISKKDGRFGVLLDFISPEGNITLKKIMPWQLPKKYTGTTLQEHLQQEIQEPIKRTVQAGRRHHGRIYMYWVQGSFGLVKIGFTTRTVDKRLKEWRSQCKRTPHSINLSRDYRDTLPLVRRLEYLIHTELRDKRVREPVCSGCRKPHKEWFVVSNELAKQVTQKWCDWMQQCPYEKITERFIKSPQKNTPVKVEEKWTLKQEHLDSLKAGELLFNEGEESSRRSLLLEPLPAPASAPPKLQSRRSRLAPSPRPRIRKSLSAGPLSGSTRNEEMDGSFQDRAIAAMSSNLLSPAHTPTPPEGRYDFRSSPRTLKPTPQRITSQLT